MEGIDRSLDVPIRSPVPGPVSSPQEALERTYLPAMAKSEWLSRSYHFGEAVEKGPVYEVWWYIVTQATGRRAYGVHGQIDRATGTIELRSGFLRHPSVGPM